MMKLTKGIITTVPLSMRRKCNKRIIRYQNVIKTCGLLAAISTVSVIMVSYHFRLPDLPKSKNYVCQTFNGRLANHIWQYASIYGISKRNNLTIILGQNDDLVTYFEVPSAIILKDRRICDTFESKYAIHCCHFEQQMIDLEPGKNYKLGEYLQSWKYFANVQDDVRRELTLKREIKSKASYEVESYRLAYRDKNRVLPVIVGVHVRRGDMASFTGNIRLPSEEYFYRGFQLFTAKYKHVVFIMCTDTMDYAQHLIADRNETIHLVHGTPIEDFAMLVSCDHVLTSVGSYGWWAGFLSRGTVVYFATPTVEGSLARTEYNYEDYFFPNWISLT